MEDSIGLGHGGARQTALADTPVASIASRPSTSGTDLPRPSGLTLIDDDRAFDITAAATLLHMHVSRQPGLTRSYGQPNASFTQQSPALQPYQHSMSTEAGSIRTQRRSLDAASVAFMLNH